MSDVVRVVARGREEAAAPFATPADPLATAAARARALRREGLLRGAIALAVAAVFVALSRPIPASVVAAIGTLTLGLALASPDRAYAAVSRAVERAGHGIGTVLAWLLLAPVFFLFFAPFRVLFRRGARDTLARGFDRSARSYWSAHGPARDLEKPY